MALNLDLPVQFFDSAYLPHVCVYTGQTHNVQDRTEHFDYLPPWALAILVVLVFIFWPGALLLYPFVRRSRPLILPQAPGARSRWSFKRHLFLWPVFLTPVLGCGIGLIIDGRGDLPPILGAFGFLFGLIFAIGLGLWGHQTTVAVKLIGNETMRLSFPPAMQATWRIYADAHAAWQYAQTGRRDLHSPLESIEHPPDADDWADEAAGDWDQADTQR